MLLSYKSKTQNFMYSKSSIMQMYVIGRDAKTLIVVYLKCIDH